MYLGPFEREIDAARAFDAKCRELGLHEKLNFPDDAAPAPKPSKRTSGSTYSKYRGVAKRFCGRKFDARFKSEFLGCWDDEITAARAYDTKVRALGKPHYCNFPDDEAPPPKRVRREWSSGYRGVSADGGCWFARYSGKYLGHYKDEVSAARAYDKEARKRGKHDWCNFRKSPRK